MSKIVRLKFYSISLFLLLAGCGFHLKGVFSMPPSLKTLQISPDQPYDDFQRVLKQLLKNNHIQIVEHDRARPLPVATLTILSQTFSERTIAYGTNGLPNRAALELKISYQLSNVQGKLLENSSLVTVERELILDPNAILGTDNERGYLQTELYRDAASQLVRQLSMLSYAE